METFMKNIKQCFKKCIDDIQEYKTYNKKIKIDLNYIVLYEFLNVFYSKEKSTEKTNEVSDVEYSRTSFYKQANQIDIDFYEKLSSNVSAICCDILLKTHKNVYTFIGVDGTYSNGEDYKPSLNMGFFDILNNIPIEITYEGAENRNKEVEMLTEKIKKDINFFKNKVIVVDRLYFCYSFIHFLIENKIKFIIRCKGDGKNLKFGSDVKDKKTKDLIKLIRPHVRIITNNDTINKTINIDKKSKKDKTKTTYDIDIQNNCVIITNLSYHFSNNDILNKYRARWNIEIYFKLVKHNFNFQHLTNKSQIEIKKQFLCINIICLICKTLDYFLSKSKKEENSHLLEEIIIKCNETKLIRFLKSIFLKEIITSTNSNLNKDTLKKLKIYTSVRKYKKNDSNPRQCKTPFLKWYIKAYSNEGQLVKILRAIKDGTVNNLNKNLKLIAEKITILFETQTTT